MRISSYGQSFAGRRSNNQDFITKFLIDEKKSIYFFAVADGMGGAAGGEVASQTVIDTCKDFLSNYFSANTPPYNLKFALKSAIKTADKKLVEIVNDRPELRGMGTTLTCVLIVGDNYVVGNIGDSRTYYYNSQIMTQITRDHSAIEDYRREHGDNLDDAIVKQYGHLITRSLGPGRDEPDIFPLDGECYQLKDDSGFLLCSDGLLVNKGETDPSEFHNYCIGKKTTRDAVESLIGYAFYGGSTDNISVICVEIGNIKRKKLPLPKFEYPPKEKIQSTKVTVNPRKNLLIPFFAVCILIVGTLLIVKPWEKLKKDKVLVSAKTPETAHTSTQEEVPYITFYKERFSPKPNDDKPIYISGGEDVTLSWVINKTGSTIIKNISYEIKYWTSEKGEPKDWKKVGSNRGIKLNNEDISIEGKKGKLFWKVRVKYNDTIVDSSGKRIIQIF